MGLVQLISPQSYAVGDKIRIELQKVKNTCFQSDTRIKEALYVPDGVLNTKLFGIIKTMPKTVRPGTDVTL